MTFPVCPCDGGETPAPTNAPQLSSIAYRIGNFASFRQTVLTPLLQAATPQPAPVEQTLSINGAPVWRADGSGDLAVMIAEWFAYVGDVVSFYNERIANEDYLRTAVLPGNVANLIALLGYRPRPAIGARGAIAALTSAGPTFGGAPVTLPKGLQFQSKPTPGAPPQIFELDQDTPIVGPDQLPVAPAPTLIWSVPLPMLEWSPFHHLFKVGGGGFEANVSTLLLQGAVKSVGVGANLLLSRGDATTGPWLATVTSTSIGSAPAGVGQQTTLTVTFNATPDPDLSANLSSLGTPSQKAPLWTYFSPAIIDGVIHLASLQRQIQPGDWVLFTATGGSPAPALKLAQVLTVEDVIWDANATGPSTPPFSTSTVTSQGGSTTTTPLPTPHTALTLTTATALPDAWTNATGVTVAFGWTSVGVLLDQPYAPWTGAPLTLDNIGATPVPAWSQQSIQLQDSTGIGVDAIASQAGGGGQLALANFTQTPPTLQPPFLALSNLLPVSCGKTVQNEVLGNGDATQPGQDFPLSQSPVTYLQQGAGYASTIGLTVNGLPWKEVASFHGQSADAAVFVTREDNGGKTHVMTGDGVNGARLPTGVNNVVATYRVGAGAASPPAGQLTVIAKPWPGLRAVLNPVAVGGGADPEPADDTRRDAPQSVLTFGRAVSVFDYEAIAAQAPGVTRASAVWAWDDARQRTAVRVYVGDNSAAATSANKALSAAGDPNRPVRATLATEIPVALIISLIVTPGMDVGQISASVATALADEEKGLFGAWNLGIGQRVFRSQIEAATLGVAGAVAIVELTFETAAGVLGGSIFDPGEGGYFTLDATDIDLNTEPDPNG